MAKAIGRNVRVMAPRAAIKALTEGVFPRTDFKSKLWKIRSCPPSSPGRPGAGDGAAGIAIRQLWRPPPSGRNPGEPKPGGRVHMGKVKHGSTI
jgi:hypothetical protein